MKPAMSTLEAKIPPPAIALGTAVFMWLVSLALPAMAFPLPGRMVMASVLGALGFITAVSGALAFRSARTTLNPTTPAAATSLVANGIYKVTRNPMYLGLLLVLTGWALFLANALGFIFLPAFVFYINRFQIRPEEKALTSVFGQEFAAYQARVRRWL